MTLGQRIQELRKGLQLSQEELGERMGVSRQALAGEEYVLCSDRELFRTAECMLSDIDLGFPQARGDQDLTLNFTLKPVKELKNWTVIGLTARIEGRDPWGQHPDGTPISREEREWYRVENFPVSRGMASLTLPKYGGETVYLTATLREKGTGRTIGTADPVFTLTAETERAGDFYVTGIHVDGNTAPRAGIPKSIALALPDPRFEQ